MIQKSTREGFGLTVAEAMWKGKPVIGGATGEAGREHVRENFLITRHLRDYLSLLAHLSR